MEKPVVICGFPRSGSTLFYKDKLPDDIKICHFHGFPRINQISDKSIIKKQWKGEL